MPDPILWLLLSLGTEAAYALLGNGIVAIDKGSGVLNFAQGAVADVRPTAHLHLVLSGMSKYLAIAIVVPESGGSARSGGRRGHLPAIARGAGTRQGRGDARSPGRAPGDGSGDLGQPGDADALTVPDQRRQRRRDVHRREPLRHGGHGDRHRGAALALYRFTRSGLATQATSQNEKGAALLGYSLTVISAANWASGVLSLRSPARSLLR